MRLVFAANVRLPTEKAHGHAIVKMCEAFAAEGLDVELWHPRRRQVDPALEAQTGRSILPFYGVDRSAFRVVTFRNLDVVRLERLPARLYTILFVVHDLMWGFRVAVHAWRSVSPIRKSRHRPDAAHDTAYMTREVTTAWWLIRFGVPVVLDVHTVPAGIRRRALRALARHAGSGLRMVALTQGNRRALLEVGLPDERIVVAGSAVDPEVFRRLPSKAECRRSLGLPVDRPIVGYIGRFETFGVAKGIAELIRAVAIIAERAGGPRGRPLLVCVGGPMEPVPAYQQLAKEVGLTEDDVRFVDHVPAAEVPRWIRSLDVGAALYPGTEYGSQYTSPLKIAEYLVAGVPIVASDLPAMREAVGGGRAEFVGREIPEDVALAIERLMVRTPPSESGGAGSVFTWQDRARAILHSLQATGEGGRLLQSRHPPSPGEHHCGPH